MLFFVTCFLTQHNYLLGPDYISLLTSSPTNGHSDWYSLPFVTELPVCILDVFSCANVLGKCPAWTGSW